MTVRGAKMNVAMFIAVTLIIYANLMLVVVYGYSWLQAVLLNLLVICWVLVWLAVYSSLEREESQEGDR